MSHVTIEPKAIDRLYLLYRLYLLSRKLDISVLQTILPSSRRKNLLPFWRKSGQLCFSYVLNIHIWLSKPHNFKTTCAFEKQLLRNPWADMSGWNDVLVHPITFIFQSIILGHFKSTYMPRDDCITSDGFYVGENNVEESETNTLRCGIS